MGKSNVISFYTMLEPRMIKKTGLFPVSLVVYFNGKKRRYRLGQNLSKEQWEKIISPKLKNNSLKKIKDKIEEFKNNAYNKKDLLEEMKIPFSFDNFEKLYFQKIINNEVDISFEQCVLEYINEIEVNDNRKRQLSLKSKIMYKTVMNSFNKFKNNIEIKNITPKLLDEYRDALMKDGKSISTIGIYLRQIRAIINYAIKMNYIKSDEYPFKDFEIPTSEPNKRALNDEEIKSIIYYKTENENEQKAIDFWTFSYLGNGLNFGDIARLKYSSIKGEIITFIRTKSKNKQKIVKEIDIYLLPQMKKIIEKYCVKKNNENSFVFPIINNTMTSAEQYKSIAQFIKTTNKYLERVSTALEFDYNFTTYYARHSWATKMRNSGVSISFISEGLGHSRISTTENYLGKFPAKDIKENANKLLDL